MKTIQERWRALLPVVQAGAEGKVIQSSIMPSEPAMFPWHDVTADNFGSAVSVYELRVKPEPKYRPFTPEEALKHEGRYVSSKTSRELGRHYRIAGVSSKGVLYGEGDVPTAWDDYDTLVRDYTFADGTPCGVPIA